MLSLEAYALKWLCATYRLWWLPSREKEASSLEGILCLQPPLSPVDGILGGARGGDGLPLFNTSDHSRSVCGPAANGGPTTCLTCRCLGLRPATPLEFLLLGGSLAQVGLVVHPNYRLEGWAGWCAG